MRRAPLGTRDDYAIVIGWIALLLAAAFLINIMAVTTRPAHSAPLNFPYSAAAPAQASTPKHSRRLVRKRVLRPQAVLRRELAARVRPPARAADPVVSKRQDRLPMAASVRVDEAFNAIALDRECVAPNFSQ